MGMEVIIYMEVEENNSQVNQMENEKLIIPAHSRLLMHIGGKGRPQLHHKLHHAVHHPLTKQNQRQKYADNLWHKGQRLLLNGGNCLKDTDDQADDQRYYQCRR